MPWMSGHSVGKRPAGHPGREGCPLGEQCGNGDGVWPEDAASGGTSCIQQLLPRAAGPGQTMLGSWPRLVGAPSLKAVVAGTGPGRANRHSVSDALACRSFIFFLLFTNEDAGWERRLYRFAWLGGVTSDPR